MKFLLIALLFVSCHSRTSVQPEREAFIADSLSRDTTRMHMEGGQLINKNWKSKWQH